jgi:hypothetical protein
MWVPMPEPEKVLLCPNCGGPMHLVRVVPRAGGLPELLSFECNVCKVVVTEPAQTPSQT